LPDTDNEPSKVVVDTLINDSHVFRESVQDLSNWCDIIEEIDWSSKDECNKNIMGDSSNSKSTLDLESNSTKGQNS